jgi:serine protease Do
MQLPIKLLAIAAVLKVALFTAPVLARPAPSSYAELAAKLLPTVVSISTSQPLKAPPKPAIPQLPPDSPLEDLFKSFTGAQPNAPRRITSLGSGFIVDPSGLIVTNSHVISSDRVSITLQDGTQMPARIVGRDMKTDLALLKVTSRKPLPFAHFGDSDKAQIGDWVMAIGNPFGIGFSYRRHRFGPESRYQCRTL